MRATENCVAGAAEPVRCRARARCGSSPSSRDQVAGERRGIAGVGEQPGLAVDDDLRHRAHARRDDGQRRRASPRAARSRIPPSATCARTRLLASSQSRGSTRPGRSTASSSPSSSHERLRLLLRAGPSRGSRASRPDASRVHARERSQQRRMILLRDQAADREHERSAGRDAELLGRHLGRRRRELVEAVVDRHELLRREARRDVEAHAPHPRSR